MYLHYMPLYILGSRSLLLLNKQQNIYVFVFKRMYRFVSVVNIYKTEILVF